jgi:DNA-binding transcriptional MerR regulator
MRDSGGRRIYDQRHLSWLELIDRLRLTGMSVAQIREFAGLVKQGKSTLAQQQALLRAHRIRVQQTIEEWTSALQMLDHKIDFYGEWLATGQRPPRKSKPASVKRPNRRKIDKR